MQHLKTSILAPISKPDSATNLTNMPDDDNNGYLRLGCAHPLAPSCVKDHLWWSLFENHRIVICHCVAEAHTQGWQVNAASSSDGSSQDLLCDVHNATMAL